MHTKHAYTRTRVYVYTQRPICVSSLPPRISKHVVVSSRVWRPIPLPPQNDKRIYLHTYIHMCTFYISFPIRLATKGFFLLKSFAKERTFRGDAHRKRNIGRVGRMYACMHLCILEHLPKTYTPWYFLENLIHIHTCISTCVHTNMCIHIQVYMHRHACLLHNVQENNCMCVSTCMYVCM